PAPTRPKVDCFYLYPTVDFGILPGNASEVNLAPIAEATVSQVGPFHEVCNLYVPLYRQVTSGTYVFGGSGQEQRSAVAFSDVREAFMHYMGQHNKGRAVVLVGHS